jgi:hypothetical protein
LPRVQTGRCGSPAQATTRSGRSRLTEGSRRVRVP